MKFGLPFLKTPVLFQNTTVSATGRRPESVSNFREVTA
jgi:hypothetical protein